jgi:hypothetical protein
MVRDFLNRVFNGSAEPLLVHPIEDRRLTADEIEEIRQQQAEADSACKYASRTRGTRNRKAQAATPPAAIGTAAWARPDPQ